MHTPIPYETMQWVLPKEGGSFDPKSGIVLYQKEGVWMVDMESNRYDAQNLQTLHEKVRHAAGRAHMRYPTVARMMVQNPEDFVVIGTLSARGIPRLEKDLASDLVQRLEAYAQVSLQTLLDQERALNPPRMHF